RRDAFSTNRKFHGLCPFPTPKESEYDTFACGHASNSISAALGMALVALKEGSQRKVVAVIGDGAMSGGLAFEGLNNASEIPNNLLIILNDNNMSIDRPVGGMNDYLMHLHTSGAYNRFRFAVSRKLSDWGLLNESRRRSILRFNNSLKSLLTNQQNIFEGMNIRYFGPANGHDVIELVRVLREIKEMKGPKLLHLHNVKGKGFKPAEEEATIWHAPGKFDKESGLRAAENTKPKVRFQDVFGETLLELCRQNSKIIGVTPAMPTGCSMNILMREMPDRAFDVGIAEGHAVTFSAGMAKEGAIPFCNIYSAFAQRAYDNVIHDAALLDLPVVLCLDRAGLVGEDGPTHHGAFDLAALRPIPNLTIASPYDEHELRRLMYTAQLPGKGTFVIRYPRGSGRLGDEWQCPLEEVQVGTGRKLKDGADLAVLTLGPLGTEAAKAIKEVEQKTGRSIAHYDMRFLKPLDEDLLTEVVQKFRCIVTVEDGVRAGGFGSAVLEWVADRNADCRVVRLGLPDEFVEHGSVPELRALVGLDAAGIARTILNIDL
ncbi:MAG: 1-deoxy-D-xylulose-5-phosphate synthase, partial [Bacteroidales bacterium]